MKNAIWLFLFTIAILLGMGDCKSYQIFTDKNIVVIGMIILLFIWGIFDPQIEWINWPNWLERR